MSRFYAPYNFVPATGKCNGSAVAEIDSELLATGHSEHPARHDLWKPQTHSGRLLCALSTTSPLVIGARQVPHEPGRGDASPMRVENYLADDGRPAVPASSLRGLVGSIAETLSQSALRVLENREFSVRKAAKPGETLSAVGRMHLTPAGEFRLEPLSFPLLRSGSVVPSAWLRAFQINVKKKEEVANWIAYYLPAYVDGYAPRGQGVAIKPGSFLSDPSVRISSTRDESTWWYARQAEEFGEEGDFIWDAKKQTLRYRNPQRHQDKKVMRLRLQAPTSRQYDEESGSAFLKVLGFAGHESQMPPGKKHELLVFEPSTQLPSLPITAAAIENFLRLMADAESREDYLPFRNAGAPKSLEAAAREGQLVYFDVEETARGVRVVEFSYSAIWRRRVSGSLSGALAKANASLVPLNDLRQGLTPAELLFGVVREEKRDGTKGGQAPAFQGLASRLRFYEAQAAPGTVRVSQPVKLQILSSPKPPSPAMYFGQQPGRAPPTKATLSLDQHLPNGRKFYLPFPQNQRTVANAKTASRDAALDKQKLVVAPIESGQTFYFEVRYENLSDDELGLLLMSLRPDPAFEHRLGLAKPLGFGHARIDVLALWDRDRSARYTRNDFMENTNPLGFVDHSALPVALPTTLQSWLPLLKRAEEVAPWSSASPATSKGGHGLVDSVSLALLVKLGSESSLEQGVPVQYPRSDDQLLPNGFAKDEEEMFAWFVNNDRSNQEQVLGRVSPVPGETLPTLKSNTKPSR